MAQSVCRSTPKPRLEGSTAGAVKHFCFDSLFFTIELSQQIKKRIHMILHEF